MTDRELLEAAAKAADIEIKGWTLISGNEEAVIGYDAYSVETWNPLTDDGDALRLAVKLGLHVSQCAAEVWRGGKEIAQVFEDCADSYAATRRAIVRAAAAIGANKEQA